MLDILYHDDHLVAIDKPPGLLVHRSNVDRHETRFAVQLLRDQLGRHVQPVHRLDRGTSGVLLFAFEPAVTRHLSQQFELGDVTKTYLAMVRGWPPESGVIDHPLSPPDDDYAGPPRPPQPATTRYRRLATVELPHAVDRYPATRYALLELQPVTGRRHQLRRHLKHIAHPIIGDATYGKGRHNRFVAQTFGCARLLLACTRLEFRHPASGEKIGAGATAGADFHRLAERFNWLLPPPGVRA